MKLRWILFFDSWTTSWDTHQNTLNLAVSHKDCSSSRALALDLCCQAVSLKPFPAPSWSSCGCHLFNYIYNQDFYKFFNSWGDKLQILWAALSSEMAIQRIFNKQWIYGSTSTGECVISSFFFTDGMTSSLSSHTFLEEKGTVSSFKKCANALNWLMKAGLMQCVYLLDSCISLKSTML